jgi:hypothetical protein
MWEAEIRRITVPGQLGEEEELMRPPSEWGKSWA